MLIIVNIVFILFYLQVEPVYLRVSNKPIQITSCVINIGNRCISRESIRVVLFSIEVVAKNMETIVLQFSGRNMSIQWSK